VQELVHGLQVDVLLLQMVVELLSEERVHRLHPLQELFAFVRALVLGEVFEDLSALAVQQVVDLLYFVADDLARLPSGRPYELVQVSFGRLFLRVVVQEHFLVEGYQLLGRPLKGLRHRNHRLLVHCEVYQPGLRHLPTYCVQIVHFELGDEGLQLGLVEEGEEVVELEVVVDGEQVLAPAEDGLGNEEGTWRNSVSSASET
jgi:hypothetical protein